MILLTRRSPYRTVKIWLWQGLSIGNVKKIVPLTLCDCCFRRFDQPATPCSLRCSGGVVGFGDDTSARSPCYYWASHTKLVLSLFRFPRALGGWLFVGCNIMAALRKGGFYFVLGTVNDD